jgi:hypothetical protein
MLPVCWYIVRSQRKYDIGSGPLRIAYGIFEDLGGPKLLSHDHNEISTM